MNKIALNTVVIAVALAGCRCNHVPTSDEKQAQAQAASLEQAHEKVGMPAIENFSEKRFMKDLYELRDKSVATHTYIVNEQQACLRYLGQSIGYGLPYAAQYTAPSRVSYVHPSGTETANVSSYVVEQIPQADPNGLFMPSSAEGTWVMLKDPNSDDVKPIYIEPRVVVTPFRVPSVECSDLVKR